MFYFPVQCLILTSTYIQLLNSQDVNTLCDLSLSVLHNLRCRLDPPRRGPTGDTKPLDTEHLNIYPGRSKPRICFRYPGRVEMVYLYKKWQNVIVCIVLCPIEVLCTHEERQDHPQNTPQPRILS